MAATAKLLESSSLLFEQRSGATEMLTNERVVENMDMPSVKDLFKLG